MYDLVARAQAAAIAALEAALRRGGDCRRAATSTRSPATSSRGRHGDQFGHGLGHGIGLATHELPTLGKRAAETPLPSPTVFSVEPGVYLDGETGVRIEDLVSIDAGGRLDRLTGSRARSWSSVRAASGHRSIERRGAKASTKNWISAVRERQRGPDLEHVPGAARGADEHAALAQASP